MIKPMKKTFYLLLILVQLLSLNSCKDNKLPKDVEKALSLAGNNKKELLKVIDNYNKDITDSLKLRAAYYLISNMVYHKYDDRGDTYNDAFLKARQARNYFKQSHKNYTVREITDYTNIYFSKAIDSINQLSGFNDVVEPKYDILSIDSNFLIENIEIAFEAYERNPLKLCNNFTEFLEHVLPYRVGNEPIEQGKRKELFERNKWVYDSLKVKPLEDVVKNIYKEAGLSSNVWGKNYKYPGTPSLSQMEDTRFGNCDNLSTYLASVFRSVGIPAGIDYVPRWGIYPKSVGHSWFFYLTEKNFEPLAITTDNFEELKSIYKISDLPKVYRRSFTNPHKVRNDVTHLYKKVYDVNVEILWNNKDLSVDNTFLSVFDYNKGWDHIQKSSKINNGKAHFNNIGDNMIYMATTQLNGQLLPLNYPFELQKNGQLKYFKHDGDLIKEATLLRKYPLFFVKHRKNNIKRIKSLNGCILQGANRNSPESFKDLFKIEHFNTTLNVTYKIEKTACYKCFRLKGPEGQLIALANFKLLDLNNGIITNWNNVEILEEEDSGMLENILDSDPLTYINKTDLILNFSFKKPRCIGGIQIQAQNGDNHITIGDMYELLYWDKEWTSLGNKKATDTVLTFQNIPKNALYWLRNHTKGKEELVFSLDDEGNQFWTGTSEYMDLEL